MRELILIFPDCYLAGADRRGLWPAELPALEGLLRVAVRRPVLGGWRAWLCRRVGRPDLAELAPAVLAAGLRDARLLAGRRIWLAQPVHLQAGLTRVELAPEGLLRLEPGEAEALARDFNVRIGEERLVLEPLDGGALLLHGLEAEATTEDPARHLGADIAAALPRGVGAAALRRLSGEVELWLHEHPVNLERLHRGLMPVSSLWFWGGGEASGTPAGHCPGPGLPRGFGADAGFAGLWRRCGGEVRSLPADCDTLEREAGSGTAVVLIEQGAGGLEALERGWVAPVAMRLWRGDLPRLTLVMNDFAFSLRPRDRFRFWRSRRPWPGQLV